MLDRLSIFAGPFPLAAAESIGSGGNRYPPSPTSRGLRCPAVEFRILGPVEVVQDGQPVELALQVRTLLARLLLAAGHVVPSDALIEALWDGDAVERSGTSIRVYVSRLRRVLGDALATQSPGYVLRIDPDQVDATRFEGLVRDGRHLLAAGAANDAAETLRGALNLWRGPALADVRDRPFARPDAARLEEARLDALEEWAHAELACGRHGAVAPELQMLTVEHPLRERFWQQRMLAEYRAGRHADALRTYQDLRKLLRDELGVDPSPETRKLELAILEHDASLDWTTEAQPSTAAPSRAIDPALPTVLLVDDHPLWRRAVKGMLEDEGAATIVAEAEDGPSAVEAAVASQPDVVLMDLHLPGLSGSDATRQVLARCPATCVLMLTSSGEEADVLEAVQAGARGYLLKTGHADAIVDAVRRASRGEPVFTPSLAGVVLDRLKEGSISGGGRVEFSVQQREVLRLVAAGTGLRETATQLGIDTGEVRDQIGGIVERLQAAGRDGPVDRLVRTLLFVDVVDSTVVAAQIGDRLWRERLEEFYALVNARAGECGGHAVKRTGDGVLLTFERPGGGVRCALALVDQVGALGVEIRAGLHVGECEVGGDDVHGMAVHIAARVLGAADPSEVIVSSTVRDMVIGSELSFDDCGIRTLKGVPGEWRLYRCLG